MATTTKFSLRLAVIGAGFFVLASGASADDLKVDKPKIDITIQKTPRFNVQGPKEKRDTQKFWIEVDVEFQASGGERTKDFVDSLEFKYFITLTPKTGEQRKAYTATIKHINIPKDEKMASVAYMSPTTVAKIIGKDAKASASAIDVAVEIRHNGKLIAGDATKSPSSKWWNSMSQEEGKVLSKSKTPFAPLWFDRYAEEEGN